MKSAQSEDLPKDLPRNPRIAPQTWGFHDEIGWIEWEIKELNLTQTDPHPDPICVQNCIQIEHHLQISDASGEIV